MPSGKNIDLTVEDIVELFQKIRKHNQYSTAVIKITGRSFSTKESQAILIHLAKSSLDLPAAEDLVLASWALLRGFELDKYPHLKGRREAYKRATNHSNKTESLYKLEDKYYLQISEHCIELVKSEENLNNFIEVALARYAGDNQLPIPHFLEPPKEQKEPVEESMSQTPPVLPPVPRPQKRKRMTKYERVQQRHKKYGLPKPCTKKEIVGITAVAIFAIILITAIGVINQNSVNEALAFRAANSSDSTDYLLSRLQRDILVQEHKEEQLDEVKVRAENGDAEAQYIIGAEYYFNYEYEKAAEWLLLSAEQDYASAQAMLCYQYVRGDGVKMDYDKALFWALRAAEQGNDLGQTLVGCCYNFGWGTDVNYEEAAKWYYTAAEQNEALALNNLGSLYFNGSGTEQSYSEALHLFKLSYDRGCTIAAYNIACMYQSGVGVEKDHDLAMEWLHLSAEGGYAPAQTILNLYE